MCVCELQWLEEVHRQEEQQVQKQRSQPEGIKIRKPLVIRFGENKGYVYESHRKCAWTDSQGPDRREPSCLLRSLDFVHSGKTMKDFQEESDTIRSKVLMDCQSKRERTGRQAVAMVEKKMTGKGTLLN